MYRLLLNFNFAQYSFVKWDNRCLIPLFTLFSEVSPPFIAIPQLPEFVRFLEPLPLHFDWLNKIFDITSCLPGSLLIRYRRVSFKLLFLPQPKTFGEFRNYVEYCYVTLNEMRHKSVNWAFGQLDFGRLGCNRQGSRSCIQRRREYVI